MKKFINIAFFALICLLATSCQEEYDPLGNNKPLPVLMVSSLSMGFDGTGGEASLNIETNADVEILDSPSWVSTSFNEDFSILTVVAQANTNANSIRSATIQLSTKTGENEAGQFINCVQAAQGAKLSFDSFEGNVLNPYWKKIGSSDAIIGGGKLTVGSKTELTYENPFSIISQPNNIVIASVDIKGGNGGILIYVNDDPDDVFKFRINMNNNTNTGSFFAFHGSNPMALGDKIPGNMIDASVVMPPIPDVATRDEYFRLEVTNEAQMPNWWQYVVNVYSLTTNYKGETVVVDKHFTRKFEIDNPKPKPGHFAVWCWDGPIEFKNFTVSAQTN